MSSPKILLVGIGEEFCQDDAIGLVIVRQFCAEVNTSVEVDTSVETIELTGDCINLIEVWQGFDYVYLVDATDSGSFPGMISRIDLQQQLLPAVFSGSTHLFGVAQTIELARSLNQLPPQLIIYGIEGQEFGLGQGISWAVKQAVAKVVQMLTAELLGLTCSTQPMQRLQ